MIPDDLKFSVAVLVALSLGTCVGMLLGGLLSASGRSDAEDAAYLRGRNYERLAHGEEPLSPAPRFEPAEDNLWRIGS